MKPNTEDKTKPAPKQRTRIQRFEITGPRAVLEIPVNAVLLDAVPMPNRIDLYYLCLLTEPVQKKTLHGFRIFQTGEDLPSWIWDQARLIRCMSGAHLFECPPHLAS